MKYVTTTSKIARKVIKMTGKGSELFNDKLVSGKRSLKVWGWTPKEYFMAVELLTKEGCKVEVVSTIGSRTRKSRTRLHVTE